MSQPVEVYPNTVTQQPSSHKNGSFGGVFIVLAVIVVISAVACFLGRLCNRRYNHQKAKQNQAFRPKEREGKHSQSQSQNHRFQHKEGDIEFGFDKKIPNGKVGGNGEAKGSRSYGEVKGEVRFADGGELKAGESPY